MNEKNIPLSLSKLSNFKSRSISPENFTGEKGKGGMATEGTGAKHAIGLGQGWKISPSIIIPSGETAILADIEGSGAIRHIWMTDDAKINRGLILRIYWEDSEIPAVECPACDFFASADYQTYAQLSSAMVCVNPRRGFNCYWEMPFRKHCRITMENILDTEQTLYYQVDYVLGEIPENSGYFHSQFRRVNPLPYKSVHTLLENIEGKGSYVGTYCFWGVNNSGWWGEGEIKFYMDGDTEFPTICGTGTEDYFCGAYNFDVNRQYTEFCTPYSGLPKVLRPDGIYQSQTRFSMYRWHVCDPIYFDENLRVTLQALGWRKDWRYLPLQDDISTVAYFYLDRPSTNLPTFPDRDMLEIN